jgi:NAD-dependent dihydropyrimidine dehydrogenase PreA subunit
MTLSRRELFAMFLKRPAPPEERPADPPASAPFSLDRFYAERGAPASFPAFAVRAAAATGTTAIGSGRRAAGSTTAVARVASSLPASPPGMVPKVLVEHCLASSSFCSICIEHCPCPGAIAIERGTPRVVAEVCDSCGRCVAACPAPILAFALVPRLSPGDGS